LQFFEQSEQFLHFSVSKWTFSSEYRLMNESIVPTGHMVLHQVRPLRHANTISTMRVMAAIANDTVERSQMSLW
jgi:hypothetical protein